MNELHLFAGAGGGESSAVCFSDIPQYVLSRLNLTVEKSSCNGSEMESCQSSRSGMMCEPLTESHGEVFVFVENSPILTCGSSSMGDFKHMTFNRRLQSGAVGELQAVQWFHNHGWHMNRTQPAIQILGKKPGSRFGTLFTVRMIGKGGIPDFTGYHMIRMTPLYRACEVKEVHEGDTMPCSRLDKDQRAYMATLPPECAWVGIMWPDGTFSMHEYKPKGSYKKPDKGNSTP